MVHVVFFIGRWVLNLIHSSKSLVCNISGCFWRVSKICFCKGNHLKIGWASAASEIPWFSRQDYIESLSPIHPSIHAYIHTCMHTYPHTYIHTYNIYIYYIQTSKCESPITGWLRKCNVWRWTSPPLVAVWPTMPRKKSGGIERREVDGTGSSGWVSLTEVS